MKNTRFMEVMFSNTDEELAKQVDSDIKNAANGNVVSTEELTYEKTPEGNVAITDNENGEVTVAEKDPNEADTYNLVAVPDEQLERFVHPSAEGQKDESAVGAPDEHVENHFEEGCVINPESPDGGLNPEAGQERSVTELVPEDGTKAYSIVSDNNALCRLFSMPQEFCDHLFSEVLKSGEVSKIGDLKIEKSPEDDNSVIITSEADGSQVGATFNGDEIELTELKQMDKTYSEGGEQIQYLPLYIIGINPYDHYLVDAQEYGIENAEKLKAKLESIGIEAVQIFEDQDQAREYAYNILSGVGANPEEGEVEEPVEEKEFSELIGANSIYTHSYSTDDTVFMSRMFSENELGITDTHEAIEKAIEDGEVSNIDGATITPIDDSTAVIEDGDEYTEATIDKDNSLVLKNLDKENAEELLDEEEHDYSDIYSNEEETRFFSENEEMTEYMIRIFSEEADQDEIEDAIESGEEIETDDEVITPIDGNKAVIESKNSGDFTEATITGEDTIDLNKISREKAEDLVDNIVVDKDSEVDYDKDDDDEEDEDEEEHDYSDIYSNEEGTKFFSENEEMTEYMVRLYSDEADQDEIEDAIESGEQIENDTEVITPIDSKTAVIESKNNGEFSAATLDNDTIDINKISEEEADDLTSNIAVQKSEEEQKDDEEKEEIEKKYSSMSKFFAEVMAPQQAPAVQPAAVAPAAPVQVDPNAQVVDPNAQVVDPNAQQPTVEDIEDKALAAVQSIKAAAEEASAQIMDAKAAPAQVAEPEIQEAQFSEKTFTDSNDQLVSWLRNK